jgi:organic radical activating enzyme
VLEVFASIQGEGLFVGEPQVFLRLRGCPLRCRYCDTPHSWTLRAPDLERPARVHAPPPRGAFEEPAWATPFRAATWIRAVEPGRPRTVSVTGGEPLAWPDFVRALKPFLGERRLHLETAGAHPAALACVLEAVDHVSLDLKLAADLDAPVRIALPAPARASTASAEPHASGQELLPRRLSSEPTPRTQLEWEAARRECLELVRGRDACAKLVLVGGTPPEAYGELLAEVERHAPELPVILQPATPMPRAEAPSAGALELVLEEARARGLAVRVVPQIHRALGLP